MYDPLTCADLPSATSSPESACGPTPSDAPAGPMTGLSGLEAALASLSHRQAKALGWEMSGICGPLGSTSSTSAALQTCLENRLQARLQCRGSTLFKLTWKSWVTPLGPSRSRLRASALPTSATGCTGWVTTTTRDWKDTGALKARNDKPGAHGQRADQLGWQAALAGWPTAAARDWKGATKERWGTNARPLNEVAVLAGWPTTTTQDSAGSRAYGYGGQTFMTLTDAARSADSGPVLTGSPVETRSGGQLNPAHPRWLMGLPHAWDDCAPMATRYVRPRQSPGSKR